MRALSLPAPVAVIDLETTGLFPGRHDRVIELAAVIVGPSGTIEREFVSLVNPGRDLGPTRLHGITAEDLLEAPTFDQVAVHLVGHLDGVVALAAHNLRFDRQFLDSEFARLGVAFPACEGLCTMELGWGGSLSSCCADFGVPVVGDAHHALADARATANLLVRLLADQPRAVARLGAAPRIHWPQLPPADRRPVSRDESRRRRAEPPTYLQRLLERSHDISRPPATDGAELAYSALLDQVLDDRRIDLDEGEALVTTAESWGLVPDQIRTCHLGYLTRLARAALADGVVTDAERRDLELVARLLGLGVDELSAAVAEAKTAPSSGGHADPSGEALSGKRVCFTGEMLCRHNGVTLTREVCEQLATAAGLTVVDSVTKKLDLLVVADPHTQSGKAKKARQYGIRVLHEPVFWRAIGVAVS